MNDNVDFDRFVADQFARLGGMVRSDQSVDDILLRARRLRPVPRWLALIKEPPMRVSSRVAVGSPTFRLASIAALTMALIVALGAVVVVGASLLPSPPPMTGCGQTSCPAGTLTEGRAWHTATSLGDGRVLIIGGASPGDLPSTSTELWDPASRTFEPSGALTTPRLRHSATLLTDGRVLVIGGHTQPGNLPTQAELWDPASGTFSVVASLATGRYDHTATLLRDGRVLVIGGSIGGPARLDSAELFDPKTESFSPAGTLAEARFGHTATLLPGDRVLVVGGFGGSDLASAELWDPASMSFSPTGSMAQARLGPQAALLLDGRVLVAGGVTGPPWAWVRNASAEAWDPDSGSFESAGSLPDPRADYGVTRLDDGRVLVTGGDDDAGQAVDTAEMWDPNGNSFTFAGSLVEPRAGHSATLLPDGQVLLVGGGYGGYASVRDSAELFDPDVAVIAPGSADPSPMR